jgi:hypothetical protein
LTIIRNQFKKIWVKELFHLVREFFVKRIHHFNGNINDETAVYYGSQYNRQDPWASPCILPFKDLVSNLD